MNLKFYKYQGTGNDFVILDNRNNTFDKSDVSLISKICHRKFGIGADGLMLLENADKSDFKMIYFNADGHESSMCGNGGRCIVAFAKLLNIFKSSCIFEAIDGIHHATIADNTVDLQMIDVTEISVFDEHVFLDTGSPHHVTFKKNVKDFDVFNEGRKIRIGEPYGKEGTNVNFVEQLDEHTFKVRTYERGVEDETLSCGTGVTAVAIAVHKINKTKSNCITLKTEGGTLKVSFEFENNRYKNVFLKGSTTLVFEGELIM